MTRSFRMTAMLVRTWVSLYTRGLAPDLRNERLAEIDSDLWEQANDAASESLRAGTAPVVLLRLTLGLPADVLWRIEAGAADRSRKERGMNASIFNTRTGSAGRARPVFLAALGLLALYQAAVVIAGVGFALQLWGGGEGDAGQGWYLTLPPCAAGLAFIWAGLRTQGSAPLKAGVLIAIGVLPSILMFWMMLPPVIAAGVAIYAILHGRSEQRRLDIGM